MIEFGRLEKVDPRVAWTTEAGHFTPWLAQPENLRLLGEAISIDLELEAQEKSVGPFRADILCKDTITGNWVLIENQLERTDHTHLGQLITYAAGLKAVTIVWIAYPFTEEHRAALDWLNQITDSRFNFFGLEIELWKIGSSQVAPKFNIACKPNDWSKTVAEGAARVEGEALTETKQIHIQYWTAFREYLIANATRVKPTKPLPQNWMTIAVGRSAFSLSAVASFWNSEEETWDSNELRAELVITGEHSKAYFAELEKDKDMITAEIGYPLIWYNPEGARVCRIFARQSANLRDQSEWEEQHRWLLNRLEDLHRVFAPRVRTLPIPIAK
jgi:Domain of unknown function (DUF4268)